MLKLLLKKQFAQFFRGLTYDPKKNRKRSKASLIGFAVLYLYIIAVMAGLSAMLGWATCSAFTELHMEWFYFVSMAMVSVTFGTFGNIFTSYSSLYLAKDNDMLLSMPIKPGDIILSRLLGVYFLGFIYAGIMFIPASVVYFVQNGITVATLIGSVVMMLCISLIVLILSAVLGWIVAKTSLHVRNKTLVMTVFQLAFIGAYLYIYSQFETILSNFLEKALVFGVLIRNSCYPLYLFGEMGTGNFLSMALYLVAITAVCFAVYAVLQHTFLKDVTATGKTKRTEYRAKKMHRSSMFNALVRKEMNRFFSCATYMLNCALGTVIMVVGIVFLVLKSDTLLEIYGYMEDVFPGCMTVFACILVCGLACMNDSAAPSISLEGKNIWLLQSLPVDGKTVLRAKAGAQLIITLPFVLLDSIVMMVLLPGFTWDRLFIVILPVVFCFFTAVLGLFFGVLWPNLNWTTETTPVKQGMAVMFALFSNMIWVMAVAGLYIWKGKMIGNLAYMTAVTVITLLASVGLYLWLMKYGPKKLAEL